MRIKITSLGMDPKINKPSGITIQVIFNQSIINDSLRTANLDTLKIIEGPSGDFIAEALAKIATLPGPKAKQDINKFLKELMFDFGLESTSGSIVSKGRMLYKKPKQQATQASKPAPQNIVSSAQWTLLTQKRLGESMLSFGEPEPPEIKERTGRFRRSVGVTANYRSKTIQYTYNPLYRSLEHYGYHPELQVERAIREVAQQLYAREFSIVRRGGLA